MKQPALKTIAANSDDDIREGEVEETNGKSWDDFSTREDQHQNDLST